MGLSLVRAALKKCALGGILESKKQEQLISAIENQVQHALAPEAGTSAAADDPRGSAHQETAAHQETGATDLHN